jgi:hypothetical protein
MLKRLPVSHEFIKSLENRQIWHASSCRSVMDDIACRDSDIDRWEEGQNPIAIYYGDTGSVTTEAIQSFVLLGDFEFVQYNKRYGWRRKTPTLRTKLMFTDQDKSCIRDAMVQARNNLKEITERYDLPSEAVKKHQKELASADKVIEIFDNTVSVTYVPAELS